MADQGYAPEQIRRLLDSGFLPPVEISAVGITDDERVGYFYDSGAISISAPAAQGLIVGLDSNINTEPLLYEKMLTWIKEGRSYGRDYYSNVIDKADSSSMVTLGTIGRAFNAAGWDIAEGVTGLLGLATDNRLRFQMYAKLESGISYAWNNPGDSFGAAIDVTRGYYSGHSASQTGEDPLRFLLQLG